MPGNNGTNITVYGSFSRSDNCDRDFQRIAAKFGPRRETVDPPPKLTIQEIKEEKLDRETKKKPTPEAPAAKASAEKVSAVAKAEEIGGGKMLTIAAQAPGEINSAAATTIMTKKSEDASEEEKNPFLDKTLP
jgi:hypothetical protein